MMLHGATPTGWPPTSIAPRKRAKRRPPRTTENDDDATDHRRLRLPPTDTRSRARRASRSYNLMLDVHALRSQIRDLEDRRRALRIRDVYARLELHGAILRTARAYFDLFRYGYRPADASAAAVGFLRCAVSEGLTLGVTGFGRDMLLEQWRRYTACFCIREFALTSTEIVGDGRELSLVRAHVVFTGTFTAPTLNAVFPGAASLVRRLRGRPMVCPMVFHLHFDRAHRITRHDVETDFLGAFARVLGDARAAATAIAGAGIADESMLLGDNTPSVVVDGGERIGGAAAIHDDDAEPPTPSRSIVVDPRLRIDYLLS